MSYANDVWVHMMLRCPRPPVTFPLPSVSVSGPSLLCLQQRDDCFPLLDRCARVLFCNLGEDQYPTRKELDWKEGQVFLHRLFLFTDFSSVTSHLYVYMREKAEEVKVKYYHIRPQIRKELSIKTFSTLFLSIAFCHRISWCSLDQALEQGLNFLKPP